MKLSRILATGAAAALVGVSTLAIGGSAVADDFYVADTDLTAAETAPYSAGWFQGNVATPGGSFTSTAYGLDVDGAIQILNGDPVTMSAPGTSLSAMAPELTSISGNPSFQISVFTTGDAGFTTLYADPAGIAADQWFTSQSWGAGAFTANVTMASLDTYQAAMEPDSQILAFGFNVIDGASAEIVSLDWNGDTYWFLPAAATATITPASLTVADVSNSTKGVTGVFTGFLPNEAIEIGLGTGASGGQIDTATADATGTVTYTYVAAAADAAVGTYFLGAIGVTSGVEAFGEFAVTANILPVTGGADFTPAVITGSLLLLLGAGFTIAARRRAVAKR